MSCPEREAQWNDYVDGELDPPERRSAEQHLESCAACRRAVEELRELIAAARALPREAAPPRDLLPAIRAAAGAPQARPWVLWAGMAASLLIVSVAAVWTLRTTSAPGREGAAIPAVERSPGHGVLAAEYAAAARLLLDSIERRRDLYAPETLEVLERNLAVIDRAIAEVEQALAADSGATGNDQVLFAMYEQKLDLLRRFSRLSS
jgi:hypothetical protein